MQGGSGSHGDAADNYRAEPMRLYEGNNISSERANGEQTGVAGFGSTMATRFDGYSTETLVAGKGFGRLPGVAAQPVLKNHRQSRAPGVFHIENRCACPGELNRIHEMRPILASVCCMNPRAN